VKDEMLKSLCSMFAAFNVQANPVMVDSWISVLSKDGWSANDVSICAEAALRSFDKCPSLKQFLELKTPKSEDSAEKNWEWVIRHLNFYHKPQMNDYVKFAVNSCGGWETLCSMQLEQLNFTKSQFLKAYAAAERIKRCDVVNKQLVDPKMLKLIEDVGRSISADKVYKNER
jgi:hypothetical protein